jgi:hypothetical protein
MAMRTHTMLIVALCLVGSEQHSEAANLASTARERTSIYFIYEKSTNKVVYVGQTTYNRDGARWLEHITQDSQAPWYEKHFAAGAYQSSDDKDWPYFPRKAFDCKDCTPLETAASEEFYWEERGGLTRQLVNRVQPLTKATFNKYKASSTFNGNGFPPNWAPKR